MQIHSNEHINIYNSGVNLMAQIKVSALTALTATDGNEEILINDGGTSKKVTIDNVLHDNSIRAEHYVDGSIATAHIADNAITSAKLGVDVIVAEDIANKCDYSFRIS